MAASPASSGNSSTASAAQLPPSFPPIPPHPPSLSWEGRIAVYTTVPAMLIFLMMRLYTRIWLIRQFGADDYISLCAGITVVAFAGVLLPQFLDDTYGRHAWELPPTKTTVSYLKRTTAETVLFCFASMFCKLTLLAFYFRIFRPAARASVLIWIGIVGVTTSYIVCTAVALAYDIPRKHDGGWMSPKFLQRFVSADTRIPFAQGMISTATDFYVLLIPITMIAPLNLSTSRKLSLIGIFSTGFVACGFSLAGTVYRYKIAFFHPSDASWWGVTAQALSVAELNLGVICGCLPVITPLIKQIAKSSGSAWHSLNSLFSSRSKNSKNSKNSKEPKDSYESSVESGFHANVLTNVPKGNLSGLYTRIRDIGKSRTQRTTTKVETDINGNTNPPGTYRELRSIDLEYHNYIEKPATPARSLEHNGKSSADENRRSYGFR